MRTVYASRARTLGHPGDEEGGVVVEVEEPPVRKDNVGGRHRIAAAETHVVAQVEGEDLAAPADAIARRQVRLRPRGIGAPEGHECVVAVRSHGVRRELIEAAGVHRLSIRDIAGDDECPARRPRGRGRTQAEAGYDNRSGGEERARAAQARHGAIRP